MTKKAKIITGALAFLAMLLLGTAIAYANPSAFTGTVQTSSATSTPAYLTPSGVSTSSLVYDSYAPTTKTQTFKANQLALAMQFVGSTTASTLTINYEYSPDNLSWYSDSILDSNGRSTTSLAYSLNTPNSMTWTYASTSMTLGGMAQGTTSTRVVMVPAPMRYVRAIFTISNATGTIWAQFVPSKELY